MGKEKDSTAIKNNMLCYIKAVAIEAEAIRRQAESIEEKIRKSLQSDKELEFSQTTIDDLTAETNNLLYYLEVFKQEKEDYQKSIEK